MKSKARRQIDKWVRTNVREPVYLAEGQVFLVPSGSQGALAGPTHYLVTWLHRQTPKRVFEEWACGCRGWYFSANDECTHIKEIKRQVKEAQS